MRLTDYFSYIKRSGAANCTLCMVWIIQFGAILDSSLIAMYTSDEVLPLVFVHQADRIGQVGTGLVGEAFPSVGIEDEAHQFLV